MFESRTNLLVIGSNKQATMYINMETKIAYLLLFELIVRLLPADEDDDDVCGIGNALNVFCDCCSGGIR